MVYSIIEFQTLDNMQNLERGNEEIKLPLLNDS